MLNQAVNNFTAAATSEKTIQLSDLAGQQVVLYFYPKDNTPGCTTEGQDFRDLHEQFHPIELRESSNLLSNQERLARHFPNIGRIRVSFLLSPELQFYHH